MTVKQGWSPATVLGAISIISGLVTFAAAVFIAMGKDQTADFRDHDRRLTRVETILDTRERELRQLTERIERREGR